jgi:UDP-glucuronate 4-epimerase
MKVLVTGAAGFIGFHLSIKLIERNVFVVGVDNLNDYYDPELKKDRIDNILKHSRRDYFTFIKADIADSAVMKALFAEHNFDVVVNLAAQAGVRYSFENPESYLTSNLFGFLNILEGCRASKVSHLLYASSSSVDGRNIKQPFSELDNVDHPVSLYAATKKSNELLAYSYSHNFNIPMTGIRFFTVYGPFGRPDMAYFKFTEAIFGGAAIDLYNYGKMDRDFTYIDDAVRGVLALLDLVPASQSSAVSSASAPHKLYNIGNNRPISLGHFVSVLEKECGLEAKKNLLPMQAGDVPLTAADVSQLELDTGFKPSTTLEEGLKDFVRWYSDRFPQ